MEMEDCTTVTMDYFDQAPVRLVSEVTVRARPEQVFACLEDASAWPRWAPAITRVEWTSPRPFEVGTTRTVHMVGGMVAEEEFIDWEPGRRMAFYFTRANMPAEAFAEAYEVTDLGDGRAKLRWVMGMTPKGASKVSMRFVAPVLGRMNQWMLGRMGRLVEREYT